MKSPLVLIEIKAKKQSNSSSIGGRRRKMYSNFLILISEHNHYHNPLHKNMIIIIITFGESTVALLLPVVVIWSVNTRAQLSLPFQKLVNDQSRCFSFTKLFACTFYLSLLTFFSLSLTHSNTQKKKIDDKNL